jgi:hypothetical protein
MCALAQPRRALEEQTDRIGLDGRLRWHYLRLDAALRSYGRALREAEQLRRP